MFLPSISNCFFRYFYSYLYLKKYNYHQQQFRLKSLSPGSGPAAVHPPPRSRLPAAPQVHSELNFDLCAATCFIWPVAISI